MARATATAVFALRNLSRQPVQNLAKMQNAGHLVDAGSDLGASSRS
jgi:hypothetical protein